MVQVQVGNGIELDAVGIAPISTLERFCCLLLVRADYSGRAPGRGPDSRGHGESLKLFRLVVSSNPTVGALVT